MHQGVDFAAETGTPIHAAAAGTVTGARPNGGYGNWIEINHDGGLKTVYGHLSAFAPDLIEGAWVERGSLSASSAAPAARPGRTCTSSCITMGCPRIPSCIRRSGACRCAVAIWRGFGGWWPRISKRRGRIATQVAEIPDANPDGTAFRPAGISRTEGARTRVRP